VITPSCAALGTVFFSQYPVGGYTAFADSAITVEVSKRRPRHPGAPSLLPAGSPRNHGNDANQRRRHTTCCPDLRPITPKTTGVTGVTIKDKTVLVTGANRGIGQALAAEALARGAKRVYAGTRQPLPHPDDRVTPLSLDVTSTAQIQAAAGQVESLDMLINNAGIALPDDLTDPAVLERHLAVNLFGTYAVTQAFLPAVTRSRGAIVNILSVNALAPLPFIIPAYSVSKAAAFSLTQSLRARVAGQGVRVHAVLPGPVDTDMIRGFDIPKASPESVALAIFDAVDNGEEEIFPDPASAPMAAHWRDSAAKLLERQLAQVAPVSS